MRVVCEQGHRWTYWMPTELHQMRRAMRYATQSERMKKVGGLPNAELGHQRMAEMRDALRPLKGRESRGRPPIEDARQSRVRATPAVVQALGDLRAKRAWWE